MELTRRKLCALIPAAAFLPALMQAQESPSSAPALKSEVFPFDKLTARTSAAGVESRPVFKGKLASGEQVEVHETMLPAGAAPHPPHHHSHSEMWLIREGDVELTINGAQHRLGPGGVGFVTNEEMHGIRNVGTTPAKYFVVAVGPGAAGAGNLIPGSKK